MTRDQLLLQARQRADAEDSDRWTDSTEILPLADAIFRREWGYILDAAPEYRIAQRTPTPDADGIVAEADLSITGENLFRILSVQQNETVFRLVDFRDAPLAHASGTDLFMYMLWNGGLRVFPKTQVPHDIFVNHLPTLPSALSSGGDTVVIPSGYEVVLPLVLAAEMLIKGGAETNAAQTLMQSAGMFRQEILGELQRKHGHPMSFRPTDSAVEWGG